jgi:hypothetical protein
MQTLVCTRSTDTGRDDPRHARSYSMRDPLRQELNYPTRYLTRVFGFFFTRSVSSSLARSAPLSEAFLKQPLTLDTPNRL